MITFVQSMITHVNKPLFWTTSLAIAIILFGHSHSNCLARANINTPTKCEIATLLP